MTTSVITTIDPIHLSAFGLIRTGDPYLQADLNNKYRIDTNYWGVSGSGVYGATHIPLQSAVQVTASNAIGAIGTSYFRTHEYYRYQAGKGMRWRMTGYSSDYGNPLNIRQWGFFDDSDGIYFQHARNEVKNYFDLVIKSSSGSTALTTIQQKYWNRNNMVDLDPTKLNIYECTFQWLGAGAVNFYINGLLVHVQDHVNLYEMPYMRTAQLPITVKVQALTGSTASGWTSVCSNVTVEGGADPALWGYTYSKPNAPYALSTTETPIVSIRPALNVNGIENRNFIIPCHASLAAGTFSAGANIATFRLYSNATLSGASWQPYGQNSNAEYDITAGAAGFVAGTLLEVAILKDGTTFDKNLSDIYNIHARKMLRRDFNLTVQETFTITCKLNSGVGTGAADIEWKET
jgi:hypothetical protein